MKRYKVIGTSPIHGHPPGDTFSAKLNPEEEDYLKGIGAIRVVSKTPKARNKKMAIEDAAERLAQEQEEEKRTPTDGA